MALLCSLPGFGQKLGAQQQAQIIQKIQTATGGVRTIQCDFHQTKKMKMLRNEMRSDGVMYFARPGKLRWQYKSPYAYTFVLNGGKVSIKSSAGTQHIDTQQNKMFRQISNIILNSVTGANLKSNTDFTVELWRENGHYAAKLLPRKKELKALYQYIKVTFNTQLSMVESVTMVEKNGDQTVITMKNVKLNQSVSESVFVVR